MYNNYFGFHTDPFSATPDPALFYGNAANQEAFATLRYGITTKKGFAVVSGEAGTGKTTLLHKLLRNLGPNVHSVFIFNTQINFDELLRLTLEDLRLPRPSDDRLTLFESLNQYLIEQLNADHIVCLLIDEAQNLHAEALEGIRLLCNLETDKEKLLQIVLAGQPELENQLARRELRQLRQRVALQCRLAPLARSEIGAYIDFRLKAAGYEGDRLFRPDAVERIGQYSEGIPRLINIICDNALLTAYADSRKQVSADVIKEVAQDLRLSERQQFQRPPKPFEAAVVSPEPSEEKEWKIVPEEVWQSRLGFDDTPADIRNDPPESSRKSHTGLKIGMLFTLFLAGSTAAFIYADQARHIISGLGINLDQSSVEKPPEPPPLKSDNDNFETAMNSVPPAPTKRQVSAPEPTVEADDSGAEAQPRPDIQSQKREKPKKEKLRVAERAPAKISNDPAIQKKKIEVAVESAIQNRAIEGVSVSFVDGTVYLDGEVATERQKIAAERAARSVGDVKRVRNRLSVKFL
ncbi:MAG TPA: AAA family ATPase [Candidatus Acidoferrales bacterium]|nr:AAA family ATPase [Candidatus Acidoferrales bacterium]